LPSYDTTTIQGGYNQIITDWVQGDQRNFIGNAAQSVNPPPPNDLTLSDGYFTLKINPLAPDADAIIQVHITQTSGSAGGITVPSGLNFVVYGDNFESLVQAGAVYYWDFRVITATFGFSLTVANGIVQFIQNVTDTEASGTPAALPNGGQPRFRGFTNANPQTNLSNTNIIFNIGDWYMNSQPTTQGPAGWQCIGQGSPGVWITFPVGSGGGGGGFTPATNWTFGTAPPVSGAHGLGDIVWNTNPSPGFPFGWICTTGGTPGTWKVMGLISL
jgi:hypothetical protein